MYLYIVVDSARKRHAYRQYDQRSACSDWSPSHWNTTTETPINLEDGDQSGDCASGRVALYVGQLLLSSITNFTMPLPEKGNSHLGANHFRLQVTFMGSSSSYHIFITLPALFVVP